MKFFNGLAAIAFFACIGKASAGIAPLIVTTGFNNESWFPLPAEQMKHAAIDTALTRISTTGHFAFIYKTEKHARSGSLDLEVTLVEPAETAKIAIRLNLPENRGSYVSSASVSLHGKNYQGIFNALEQLGRDGAEQLVSALPPEKAVTSNEDDDIRQHIIDLNLLVIKLGDQISEFQKNYHNNSMMEQLIKLDTINDKLDAQRQYLAKSDAEKNRKLDAILGEIKKLNIGSNTDNRPPDGDELTDQDIAQLPKLKQARELKYEKEFSQSRKILENIVQQPGLSPAFRKGVNEEIQINLPLYEAEIVKNDVSGLFMRYLKNDEYKTKLKYVSDLYDSVLGQPDLSLTTRNEVSRKKDELNITGDSMQTASMMMRTVSLQNLKMGLRDALIKHNVRRAMDMRGAPDSSCPTHDTIKQVMERAKITDPIISYKLVEQSCELVIGESSDKLVVFLFDEMDTTFEHKKR